MLTREKLVLTIQARAEEEITAETNLMKYCQNERAVLWKGLHNTKEACQHIWFGHIRNVVPYLFFP